MGEREKVKRKRKPEEHIGKPYGIQLVDLSLAMKQGLLDKQLSKDTTRDKKEQELTPHIHTQTPPQVHTHRTTYQQRGHISLLQAAAQVGDTRV